jgi:hypothetical protein
LIFSRPQKQTGLKPVLLELLPKLTELLLESRNFRLKSCDLILQARDPLAAAGAVYSCDFNRC